MKNIANNLLSRIAYVPIPVGKFIWVRTWQNLVEYVHLSYSFHFNDELNWISRYLLKPFSWIFFIPKQSFLFCHFLHLQQDKYVVIRIEGETKKILRVKSRYDDSAHMYTSIIVGNIMKYACLVSSIANSAKNIVRWRTRENR